MHYEKRDTTTLGVVGSIVVFMYVQFASGKGVIGMFFGQLREEAILYVSAHFRSTIDDLVTSRGAIAYASTSC